MTKPPVELRFVEDSNDDYEDKDPFCCGEEGGVEFKVLESYKTPVTGSKNKVYHSNIAVEYIDYSGCVSWMFETMGLDYWLEYYLSADDFVEGYTYRIDGIEVNFYRGDGWEIDDDEDWDFNDPVCLTPLWKKPFIRLQNLYRLFLCWWQE